MRIPDYPQMLSLPMDHATGSRRLNESILMLAR